MAAFGDIRHVHLVGSIAFESAEEAFDQLGRHLGFCADRFPDGETGARKQWILWQQRTIEGHPQFEKTGERIDPRNPAAPFGQYKLKPGLTSDQIAFGPLGYAEEAVKSFALFRRKREAGVLPAGARFLVSLPTPIVFNWAFLPDPADQALVEPACERAMIREVGAIAAAIPHESLAIQWDIAAEMTALERGHWVGEKTGHTAENVRRFGDMMAEFASRAIRLANVVPASVELCIHLCYGDFGHRHSIEPRDLGRCVEMANRIAAGAARPIQLVHMPVPRDRDDDAYFAPLGALRLRPETQLSLGLVHHTGGLAGTRRRMATADRHWRGYSIATECGMGRRPAETMPALLAIHAEAARAETL
jgi:hypothetical protein